MTAGPHRVNLRTGEVESTVSPLKVLGNNADRARGCCCDTDEEVYQHLVKRGWRCITLETVLAAEKEWKIQDERDRRWSAYRAQEHDNDVISGKIVDRSRMKYLRWRGDVGAGAVLREAIKRENMKGIATC